MIVCFLFCITWIEDPDVTEKRKSAGKDCLDAAPADIGQFLGFDFVGSVSDLVVHFTFQMACPSFLGTITILHLLYRGCDIEGW